MKLWYNNINEFYGIGCIGGIRLLVPADTS